MIQRDKLPLNLKIFHGLGSVAYGVKDNGFSVFLLIFYNQVLGLDAALVGTAIMAALFADAFADLAIGELGDRTQTKWGRRLPWLYSAAVPLGIAWLALWTPPQVSDNLLLLWLFVFAIIVRSLVSACEVPSIALVPELTGDYHERTGLMRYRFLFGWAGGLLIAVAAYGLIFRGENGVTQPGGYPAYAWLGAILITGSVLVSALAQHKYVAHPSPPRPARAATDISGASEIIAALREVGQSLSNRAFVTLCSAALFAFISQAVSFAMMNYVMIYIWRLDQTGLTIYSLTLFLSVIAAFILVHPMSKHFGKKHAAMFSAFVSAAIFALLYATWLFRFFPGAPDAPNQWLMFAVMVIVNSFAIVPMMLNSSMVADVVEASQAETGRRSEGLFFAGYFFMQKFALGIGIFISGQIISRIGFPAKAAIGGVSVTVLNDLAIYTTLMIVILSLTYIILLRRFPISQGDHEERVAALQSRNVNRINEDSPAKTVTP